MTFRGSLPCFRCLQTPCWLIQVSVTSHLMDNKLRWKALKENVCYTIEWLSSFLLWHMVLCFEVLLLSASFSKHWSIGKQCFHLQQYSCSVSHNSCSSPGSARCLQFCILWEWKQEHKTRKLCELYCTLYVPVLQYITVEDAICFVIKNDHSFQFFRSR